MHFDSYVRFSVKCVVVYAFFNYMNSSRSISTGQKECIVFVVSIK